MTKFSVTTSDFEKSSISEKQINFLFSVLEEKVRKLQKQKINLIKQMQDEHLNYRLKTIGKNFVMVITREQCSEEELCIGYPFPIISKTFKNSVLTPFRVKYFLRGEILRSAQKSNFIAKLRQSGFKVKETEYTFPKDFEKVLRDNIITKKIKYINYVDLYRFVGDSFLSTYMLDIFSRDYKINKQAVYSANYKHIAGFYESKSLAELESAHSESLFIFSDLLDIDDAMLQDFVTKSQKDGIYIVNSRNYFIVKSGKNTDFHSLKNKENVLLTKDNIFDYMKNCVRPFVKSVKLPEIKANLSSKIAKIYINPYASLEQKSLSINEIENIVKTLKKILSDVEIFVPSGYNAETKKFSGKIKKAISVSLLEDSGIYNLYEKIKQNDIDLVITVDSAITHILTKFGIENIVLYKEGFWDAQSLQSLSAESPIAFCSSYYWQYPMVFKEKEGLKDLSGLVGYLNNRSAKIPQLPKLLLMNKCFSKSANNKIERICENLGIENKLKRRV